MASGIYSASLVPPGIPMYSWTLRQLGAYVFNLSKMPPTYVDPAGGGTVTFNTFTNSYGETGYGYNVRTTGGDFKKLLVSALGGDPQTYKDPRLTYYSTDPAVPSGYTYAPQTTIKKAPAPLTVVVPPSPSPTAELFTGGLIESKAVQTTVPPASSVPVEKEKAMALQTSNTDIIDVILGGLGGYQTGGVGGAVTGVLGALGGGVTGGETGSSGGVLPTGMGTTQLKCPTGYVLGADGLCKPISTGGGMSLTTGCATGYKWDASKGQCVKEGVVGWVQGVLPGGKTGTQADIYGSAVVGAWGKPALQPGVVAVPTMRCPRGTVLGLDDLCYPKGSIRNSDRKWPKPTRPLLSSGDMKTLRKISTIQNRVKKAWQSAGKPGQARPKCSTRRKR